MSEAKKWVGYADLLEAKRRREEKQDRQQSDANDSSGMVTEARLPSQTRQVTETSQVTEPLYDRSQTRQVTETSQVSQTYPLSPSANLISSLPEAKGYTRFYHQIVDHLYPQLDAYEQTAHMHLFRLSWGYGKPFCTISLQKLSERAGLSYKSCQRAVNSLERRGLVRRGGRIIGYGKLQGIEIWVTPATCQVTESSQVTQTRQGTEGNIKRNNPSKENLIKVPPEKGRRLTSEELREHTKILADLLASGYTQEQAEKQFAGGFDPDDWRTILASINQKG